MSPTSRANNDYTSLHIWLLQNIREEVCQLKSKRECFDWKRKVCDLRPASVTAEINWTNEKLVPKRNGSETRQKCETVSKCKYEDIEKVVSERVPVQNCEDIQDTQQQCKNVPTAVPRVSKSTQHGHNIPSSLSRLLNKLATRCATSLSAPWCLSRGVSHLLVRVTAALTVAPCVPPRSSSPRLCAPRVR